MPRKAGGDPGPGGQDAVLAFLADPGTHGLAEPPTRIDTHAAIVFLAGDYAYKVKRAVRYPYLDFSTLQRRKAACDAEIRLNRPNAPDIYLDVVAITRKGRTLRLGGDGQIVEWAVRMRRFDPEATLDHVAARRGLDDRVLTALVHRIVAAHERAPAGDARAAVQGLAAVIGDNADDLKASDLFPADRAADLAERWESAYARLRELLLERGRQGHVRRCHGDLHLRNIVLIEGDPFLFDALEFDDSLATTDVLYDLAFLLMDLWERDEAAAANAVRNRYLWQRDEDSDISGCGALPLFMSQRAAIRAKVAASALPHLDRERRAATEREARRYFETAEACMAERPPRLVAIGGLSGSGKSTVSADLAPRIGSVPGAIHLRSDIERKRLFGVADTQRLPAGAYGADVTAQVYARLRHRAKLALAAGQSAVVDAVHELDSERGAIEQVARDAGVRFTGLWLEAEPDELVRRVAARHDDASDADEQVVRSQLARSGNPVTWRRIAAGGDRDAVSSRAMAAVT